jgi:hypothetical protein
MMTDRDVSRLQVVHIQSCVFWDVTSCTLVGRAIAQAVSLWLTTMAAQVKSCGAGFLLVLQLHLPIIHSIKCPTVITIYLPELIQ